MTTDPGGVLDTLSVLITDIVGSTEQRSRLGDDAADALQHAHDELVAAAIGDCGGSVVKGLGDGVLATFGAAADAVAAAVAIQQAVEAQSRRSPDGPTSVRVGVSIGDVAVEGGDVLGTPVVEAARLCAAANAGEILVAELVRMLARGRGGFTFEPLGELELKGLPDPVPACRVWWEPAAGAAQDDELPLPPALTTLTTTPYVGREDLMNKLSSALADVRAGGCRTVLLAGEPGVGKTRTAAEIGRAARELGAAVLLGRCDEEVGGPYQPFVEALDWYARASSAPRLGRLGGELIRLVPELQTLVPGLPDPVDSDPRSEEYRLLEAVTSWLVDVAGDEGLALVLVIDDLHWAAKPTLRMLTHVIRSASNAGNRLLVLATYRDTDIDRAHPLSAMLSELRRLPGVDRIAIRGLSEDEVVTLVERAAGHALDDDARQLAIAVHAETEGNPFFVTEVLRHLVETGSIRRVDDRFVVDIASLDDVPEGVRDVVGRRVSRLSDTANAVLSVAAVVGRDVGVDVAVAVAAVSEDEVLDALDEGIRARLIEEVDADRFRFSHALVRATLYDELSATRRRRLHRHIADTLEKLHPDDVVALAYHTLHAGPDGGDVSRAVRYSIAAGEMALAGRALADAEHRFQQALELLHDAEAPEEALELRAMCGLGEAQRDQGNPSYRATLVTATRQALASGLTELAVRAVLANDRGMISIVGDVDEERVELLEAVLDAAGDTPNPERALMLAQLATEVTFAGDGQRRRRLVDEAESLARQLGDPRTLALVLTRSAFAAVDVHDMPRYEARCRETVELADHLGDPSLQALARLYWSVALLANGDLDECRRATEEMCAAAQDASPAVRWMARAQSLRFLILDGRFEEAVAENDELLAMGQALGEPDCFNWWATLSATIAWYSGRAADVADLAGEYADRYPRADVWRGAQVWFLAAAGRSDEARTVLERYALDPAAMIEEPFPYHGPCELAYSARLLGDADLARTSGEVLEPHRGRWAHYWLGTGGPIELFLGYCEAAMGHLDAAVASIEAAHREVAAKRCQSLVTMIGLDLAQTLVDRGAPGDRGRAGSLLESCREEAVRTGATGLHERATRLLAALDS